MYTIYKYEVPIDGVDLLVPVGGRFLKVGTQRERVCVWVLVDTDAQCVLRKLRVFGTGHAIEAPDKLTYLGTTQQLDGAFIWHVFEEI